MAHGSKSTQSLAEMISMIRAPSENACMHFKTRVLRKTDVPLTKLRGKNIIKPKKYII